MKYAKLCDAGYPTEEIGALFTADAVWDGGEAFGRYEGREQIKEFFASANDRVDWAMHYTVSGDITVADDSQTASATWYLWQPMTFDGDAVWLMARYDDKYAQRRRHLAVQPPQPRRPGRHPDRRRMDRPTVRRRLTPSRQVT